MHKIVLFFFMACMSILGAFQQELQALSSSIAIPCYYKHFNYLPSLLTSLAEQTCLPDEVVISLSQVEYLTNAEMDNLEAGPWPFKVKIIRRIGVFMEGSNRTTAALHCAGDIVLCVDADDIPHPQRVEAVLELFSSLPEAEMVLCGHAYCPGESIVCETAIPFYQPSEYAELRFNLGSHTWKQLFNKKDLMHWSSGVHNGSPSIRRSLLDNGIYWSDLKNGADLEFNSLILAKHTTYLIQLPLLHYFNGRSSGADIGRE